MEGLAETNIGIGVQGKRPLAFCCVLAGLHGVTRYLL